MPELIREILVDDLCEAFNRHGIDADPAALRPHLDALIGLVTAHERTDSMGSER